VADSGMVIDTTILIQHLRTLRRVGLSTLDIALALAPCKVTAVIVYELYVGATTAEKVRDTDATLRRIDYLAGTITSARRAGLLCRELLRRNLDIGPLDVLIAAACLEADLPLLTTNPEHFLRVPNLTVLYPDLFTPATDFADIVSLSRARNRLSRQQRGWL
jgi:tRNA(fMet)-specific endonuclease VapC